MPTLRQPPFLYKYTPNCNHVKLFKRRKATIFCAKNDFLRQAVDSLCHHAKWFWFAPEMSMDRIQILTFFGRIGTGLGFSVGSNRSRIVMSRVCQLKYAMSYVRTPLSFKSKPSIELLIYNPFQRMIPHNSTSLFG